MLKNYLVLCYLIGKQKIMNIINICKIYLLNFRNIKIIQNGIIKNININLYLYNLFTIIITFIIYIENKLIILRSIFDINVEKIHITKFFYDGERTIIIDKSNQSNNSYKLDITSLIYHNYNSDVKYLTKEKQIINLEYINILLNNIELDNTMLKNILVVCDLIIKDEKYCLKKLFIKYKDINMQYNHTLKNILIFNKIKYEDNSILNIKLIKNKKILNSSFKINDILEKHIYYLLS